MNVLSKRLIKKAIKAITPYGALVLYRRIIKQGTHNPDSNNDKLKHLDKLNYFKKVFIEEFLRTDSLGNRYFDINGAKLPDIRNTEEMDMLFFSLEDTFLFPLLTNEDYSSKYARLADIYMNEGPYGYTGEGVDITVKAGEVVLDLGAWIGDFSAQAAAKEAIVYAFEPTPKIFALLEQTVELNKPKHIEAIQYGVSNKNQYSVNLYRWQGGNDISNSLINSQEGGQLFHSAISTTTVDSFVHDKGLEKVDFIKSDIDGAERLMLQGAKETLQRFAPKLAICTYHFPDDPQILEGLIKEANPDYKVVHLRRKLFAQVPGKA